MTDAAAPPAPADARQNPSPPINLAAVLATLVVFELAIGRIFVKLLPEDGAGVPEWFNESSRFVARFLGLFSATLAWLLVIVMLGTLARRAYYRRSTRVSMLFIGSVFAALVGLGLFGKIPGQLLLHLYLSFFFLSASVLLAIVASDAPMRQRLGVALLLLPVAARFLIQLNDRFATFLGWQRLGDWVGHTDAATLVFGVIAAVLLSPFERPRRLIGPLIVAALMAGLAAGLVQSHWDVAQRIAQSGFGIELPLQPWVALAYCVGFGAMVYAIVASLGGEPRDRLRGYGVCLLVTNGLYLYWPSQLAIAMVGLFCIMESMARPSTPAWTRPQQEELLRHAAVAAGATSVTFSGAAGEEAARLVGTQAGQPVEVIVDWRGGRIVALEISIGAAPPRDPPFTLARRGTSEGPSADGPRLELDDETLDRQFIVYDRKSVAALILTPEAREPITHLLTGWFAAWPQRGLRYRSARLAINPTDLARTVELLLSLWTKLA